MLMPNFFGFVGHVQQQHGRQAQLLDLQGKAELALDLGGVEDDDNQIERIFFHEMAYYLFVVGEAVQVVDAGQVNQFDHLAGEQQLGAQQVDRDARPVADPGRSAGGAVEERGFAGVRHAHQSDVFHRAGV